MRYPPGLLDEIRARLSVSQVVMRKVALKKAGREWKGLSPFKVERTPSFFVNDQKGFFHCFASGEHGDIFAFVMKTEGLSFPEAVERLAEEAGVAMPKPTERDAVVEDERARLVTLLDASARFFEDQLKSAAGTDARRYATDKRGLRHETISAFRLGFAPAGRTALKDHLGRQGFKLEDMISSGMIIAGDDIPTPYDRFRNRLMFPIQDQKGRIIAFGGRALSADAPAKYLNSPETPLFHKGSILFNAHRARPLAHDCNEIVAVEGYMDVVALSEAGFGHAVAPLGTALTEDQVKLLWRMVPEPTLCFDGDSAGRKAAFRAVETVLPHLKPGFSIRFAFLPDGLDPDDLVRQQGAEAMRAVLDAPRPLVDMLWEREWGSGQWSTPERRAQLQKQVYGLLARIEDSGVREHYQQAMREKLNKAWGGGRGNMAGSGAQWGRPYTGSERGRGQWSAERRNGPFADRRSGPPFNRSGGANGYGASQGSSNSLKRSSLVAGQQAALPCREALLLRTLMHHPWLIEEHAEQIAAIELTAPALARLRDALLSLADSEIPLDSMELRSQLRKSSLDKVVDLVERTISHKSDKFAEPQAVRAEVETGWRHTLALHDRQSSLRRALVAAERTWHQDESEDALARIREIKQLITSSDAVEALAEDR